MVKQPSARRAVFSSPHNTELGAFGAVLTMIALAGIVGAALSRGISETA